MHGVSTDMTFENQRRTRKWLVWMDTRIELEREIELGFGEWVKDSLHKVFGRTNPIDLYSEPVERLVFKFKSSEDQDHIWVNW